MQVAAGPRFQVLRRVVWIHEARALRGLRRNDLVDQLPLLESAQLIHLDTVVFMVQSACNSLNPRTKLAARLWHDMQSVRLGTRHVCGADCSSLDEAISEGS